MEAAVIGGFAGALGGVLAYGILHLRLEMDWWVTRRTLQRFFTQQRKTRIAELPAERINGPLTPEQVESRYRARLRGE